MRTALSLAIVLATATPLAALAQTAPSHPRKVLIWPGKVGGLQSAPSAFQSPAAPRQPDVSAPIAPVVAAPTASFAAAAPRPVAIRAASVGSPAAAPVAYAALSAPRPAPFAAPERTIYDAPPTPTPARPQAAPVAPPPIQPAATPQAQPAPVPVFAASTRRPIWDPRAGRVVRTETAPPPAATSAAGPRPAPTPPSAVLAQAMPRMYSVHREFGYQPDPSPDYTPRAVTLVAPDDAPEEVTAIDLAGEDLAAEPEGPLPPRDRQGRRAVPNDRLLGAEVE